MDKLKHLDVIEGDEVIEKETNRLGCIHKKNLLGSKSAFIVTWLDDGTKTAYFTKKDQNKLMRTGRNMLMDSDTDEE